jgi:hypothetical protein
MELVVRIRMAIEGSKKCAALQVYNTEIVVIVRMAGKASK